MDIDLLMYARYGELGDGMDAEDMTRRAKALLADPKALEKAVAEGLQNKVYGVYLSRESLISSLKRLSEANSLSTNVTFNSVEQGYQYSKTFFSEAPEEKLEEIRKSILSTTNGDKLRDLGHSIPSLDKVSWNAAKYDIMKDLIRESFLQNENLALSFIKKTDGFILTHNQDSSDWKELFPKALMEVRDELKERYKDLEFKPSMYVTYYGSKNVPSDSFKVQISTSRPEGMDVDVEFETLYPDFRTMVGPHKDKKIDDAEYTRRYTEKVLEPNKEKILTNVRSILDMAKEAHQDVYMYCYCAPGQFCHRYLVNNFLNENGISCQENPADRLKYDIGHVQLYGETPQPDLFNQPQDEFVIVDSEKNITESVPEPKSFDVVYTESEGDYKERTEENANANDVDFTFQFAADFSTAGERCTTKAAGNSCFPIPLLDEDGKFDLSAAAVNKAVKSILDDMPEEYLKGEPCGINIAGNGIYTLQKYGINQMKCDTFVSAVFSKLQEKGINITSVRSGGQSGVDESAVAVGHVLNIPVTVHAPAGWKFRTVDNHNVSDEAQFKSRFDKNYSLLKSSVKKLLKEKSTKTTKEVKF